MTLTNVHVSKAGLIFSYLLHTCLSPTYLRQGAVLPTDFAKLKEAKRFRLLDVHMLFEGVKEASSCKVLLYHVPPCSLVMST